MADNSTLPATGDGIRTVDRSGSGPKTQVLQLDVGAAGAGNELLLTAGPKQPAASMPMTLPNDVMVGAAASLAALNIDLLTGSASGWYDAANFHSASIQVIGAAGISAGAVFFEQTNDITAAPSGNFWAVEEDTGLTPTPQIAAITIAASTTRMFRGPVTARYVRVRASTAFVGGNVQAVACFSQMPYQRMVQTVHQATAGNMNVTAAVTGDTAAAASADALANPTIKQIGADLMNFNGTSWDRQRANVNVTMGDTGAKVTSFAGATQTNFNARGAKIMVLLGAVTGTITTFTAQLQMSPDGGTTWLNFGPASTSFTPVSGNTILFDVYPTNETVAGATPAALTTGATQTVQINGVLPRTWRLNYVIVGTSPSITFTNAYAAYTN
jgi:hypothetical protein